MGNQQLQPNFERINWEEQEKQTIIPKIEILAAILINYTTALQSLCVISGDKERLDQTEKAIQTYTQADEAQKQAYETYKQATEAYKQADKALDQAIQTYTQTNQAQKQAYEAYTQADKAYEAKKQATEAQKQAYEAYKQATEAYKQADEAQKQARFATKALTDKDYTKDESPHIQGIATTIKRFSDTFTQIIGYRTKNVTITDYDHAPHAPSCEVRVRTYKAQVIEAITDVLNRERAEEEIHQAFHKSSRPTDPLQLAAYEEKIIKNIKYLCNGMRGLLNALIDLNDGKRITDDFRRGELRGLATLGLNPDQIRKLYPQREKMHKLINEFEDHTIESIFLS